MEVQGKRLRLLYPDLHGLERGKYLYGEKAVEGVAAFCVGVYPLTHDKEILPVPRTQFDVGLHDVDATLDRDSLHEGWEENTIVGVAESPCTESPLLGTHDTSCGRPSNRGDGWAWNRRWRSSWSSICWSHTRADGPPCRCPRTACTAPACRSTPPA